MQAFFFSLLQAGGGNTLPVFPLCSDDPDFFLLIPSTSAPKDSLFDE